MKPNLSFLVLSSLLLSCGGSLVAGQLDELRTDIEYTKGRIEKKVAAVEKIKEALKEMSGDYEERSADLEKMEEISKTSESLYLQAKDLEYSIRKKLAVLEFYESKAGASSAKVGSEFAEVKLKSGRVLQKVEVQKVEGMMLKLRHSGGFIDVEALDLPEAVVGSILIAPADHNIGGLPKTLFRQRPKSITDSDVFAKIKFQEQGKTEDLITKEMDEAEKKRIGDLTGYRAKQHAMHEKFLEEGRQVARLRDSARQDVLDGNREIDKQLVVLFQKIDDLAVESEELEKSFNMMIVDYDRVGGRLSRTEATRRKKNVGDYLGEKERLNQDSARIRKKIIALRAQKK